MRLSRRGLFGVGAGLLAAPSIVQASNLMPSSSAWFVPPPGKTFMIKNRGATTIYLGQGLKILPGETLELTGANASGAATSFEMWDRMSNVEPRLVC